MDVRTPRRNAMTLIEILLVVAIMAILAGLVIPNANPSLVEQLRGAAGILASDLAYARSQSVTYGSEFRVTFDTVNGEYEIEHVGSNPALDDILRNPFDDDSSSTRYRVVLAELPSLGPLVHLAAVSTVDASDNPLSDVTDVTFESLGETTRAQDTRIWLAVGSGSATRTITVQICAVTGLASVEPPGEYPLPADVLAAAAATTP